MAQLGRALGSGPRGRWFKSSQPDHECQTARGFGLWPFLCVWRLPPRIEFVKPGVENGTKYRVRGFLLDEVSNGLDEFTKGLSDSAPTKEIEILAIAAAQRSAFFSARFTFQ